MKMVYQADDGTTFEDEHECLKHEQLCKDVMMANVMLDAGANLLDVLIRANRNSPGWDNHLTKEDKELLLRITKNTEFIIKHWHGSNLPEYRIWWLNRFMEFYTGDPPDYLGYAKWLKLRDVLQYARETAEVLEEQAVKLEGKKLVNTESNKQPTTISELLEK